MKKPVVGFIAGVTAPRASAWATPVPLISGGADTADAKLAIMEECGLGPRQSVGDGPHPEVAAVISQPRFA